jgi:hypothetical protein
MRTLSWHRIVPALVFLALCGSAGAAHAGVRADGTSPALPENWEARSLLRDTIFAPIGDAARHARVIVNQSNGGGQVSFQVDTQSGALYLVFANQEGRSFPVAGAGTFIIKRSLKDGSFLHAKVFVQNDPGCFLRLYPSSDRTVMDVFLAGEPFLSQVVLPVAFERLLTAPLARIMDLTGDSIDWSLLLAPSSGPGDMRLAQVARAVRTRLKGLRDMDDGAMDSAGHMVYIASGVPAGPGGFNCSGFAKWIVDGFYAPLAGRNTDIAALKSRDAMRGNRWSARYEEELDPYFGLDWSRGLARSIAQARTGTVPPDVDLDVRDADHVAYTPEAGYPVPRLRALLYFLARERPGTIYLGSVNAASQEASQEGTPTLRQHHHVIVLLPYFQVNGDFQVVVLERNTETSLASLTRRYGREYVHLVHLDSMGEFSLPQIE